MQTLIFSLPSLNNYLNIYNYKIYIVGSKHKNSCMMSKNHNPSKSLNFLLNLNPSSDSSTQRKINLENKRSTQSFLSIDQKKKPFSPDYEKLRFSPKHKNPFQKRIYKKVDRHNTGILFETQKFKDILKTKNNFNDEEKKSSKRFYAKSIRPFSSMNDKNEEIPINSQKKISKLDQNTLKYINSPQNCLPNDSILKNDKKLDYPKKIDLFYSTTMLCHIFQSSLKEKERDRLSLFLTNDWINKVLLDRKVEDVKNSEFIQPLSQRQIIQRKMEENKRIRKHFKSEIIKAKQNNNFLIPQKSLEKFRKTILLPNKIENQLDSEEMHSKVKLYGERDKDFHEEMEILKKLKKNEKKKKFVYHRIKKFKLEEIRASVLDYVSFLKELEELHGNANFKDCIPDKPYHNVGSYLFLKLVKRNKLEDVKKMLEENNFLIYEFDELSHTALHNACKFNLTEMSEYLISKRARINVKDRNGKTPLYYATKSNNHKIIKLLFLSKAYPWSSDRCDYKSLDQDEDTRLYFKQARKVDLIKRMTPLKIKTRLWIEQLYSIFKN